MSLHTHATCAPSTITLRCPAKVNLALAVGAPVQDAGGYHPLASWMVGVTFCDLLTVRRLDEMTEASPEEVESSRRTSANEGQQASGSRFDITFASDAPQPQRVNWPLESDLTCRAHRLLEARAGRPLSVEVTLRKQVPAGAGLAGGSADAAGMLLAVNELFDLQISATTLHDLSGQLGSDVGFSLAAMTGHPAAIVTGRGEHIEPSPLDAPLHLVLILPPLTCPTGSVYQAFDATMNHDHRLDGARVRELAKRSGSGGEARGGLEESLFNDLAAAAMQVTPALKEVRARAEAAAGHPVHVTGSGAGLFVLADSAEEATALAWRIRRTGVPAVATRAMSGTDG